MLLPNPVAPNRFRRKPRGPRPSRPSGTGTTAARGRPAPCAPPCPHSAWTPRARGIADTHRFSTGSLIGSPANLEFPPPFQPSIREPPGLQALHSHWTPLPPNRTFSRFILVAGPLRRAELPGSCRLDGLCGHARTSVATKSAGLRPERIDYGHPSIPGIEEIRKDRGHPPIQHQLPEGLTGAS